VAQLVAVVLLLLVLAGCRTEVTVDIHVDPDGTGEVVVAARLDADAVAALGGTDRLALDDLPAAGWTVDGPGTTDDGGAEVSAGKEFTDEASLRAVLDEVVGAGVFHDTSLEVSDGFARTDYELATTVEVTGDPSQFADDELVELLGGLPLGRTLEELVAEGVADPSAGELVVRATLPGAEPAELARVALTGGTPALVEGVQRSRTTQERVVLFAVAAVVVAVLGVVALVVDRVRSRAGRVQRRIS